MDGTLTQQSIERGLEQFQMGVEFELQLDVQVREKSKLGDMDAINVASQATDAYMAACSTLMGTVAELGKHQRLKDLVLSNISFIMARIEQLQVLMQRRGSAYKHISMTEDQLKQQRARARISQPTDSNEVKRGRVAAEILATEKSYVKALNNLVQFYVQPFSRGEDPILDATERSAVFGNVEEILGLAQSFMKALQEKMDDWGPGQTLGDTFKNYAMFFKIYVIYTNGYESGVKYALKLIKEDPRAAAIAKNATGSGCQDIQSLMINPIQRLPRYVLLLKELRKRTKDTHPDARFIEAGLADIQVVADHVNERLRSHEDNAKILEIQSALWTTKMGGVPITLLEPGRKLVKEGKLVKIRSIGTLRDVHVFLFSDIMLYCTSSKLWPGRYHYHNHLSFYGASPGSDAAMERGVSTTLSNLENAFKVTSEQAVRVFIAASIAERDEWIRTINLCAEKKKEIDGRRLSHSSVPSLH